MSEREIEAFIGKWLLIPSKGGVFEVTVNNNVVFSKKELGRHAEPGEIRAAILKVLETVRPPGVVVKQD